MHIEHAPDIDRPEFNCLLDQMPAGEAVRQRLILRQYRAQARLLWVRNREEIVAEWCQTLPLTRPQAWWLFEYVPRFGAPPFALGSAGAWAQWPAMVPDTHAQSSLILTRLDGTDLFCSTN